MIKKIVSMENIGCYSMSPVTTSPNWNGEFKKSNIIYGENGVGKTTLSVLLRSLKGDNSLLHEKLTIGATGNQKVKLLLSNGQQLKFSALAWSTFRPEIEIFDIHFVEDNVYIGSSLSNSTQSNLFEIVVGTEGLKLREDLREQYKYRNQQLSSRRKLKGYLKTKALQLSSEQITEIKTEVESLTKSLDELRLVINYTNTKLGEYSSSVFDSQIEKVNKYLSLFTSHIRIEKFSKKNNEAKQMVSYFLSVDGERVGFERSKSASMKNVKFALSEGDKSAVAFAFFLSSLDQKDLTNSIVVFDDPISSFDDSRRNSTIAQLQLIATRCKQIFFLTHEIYFAKMLTRRMASPDTISLKIKKIAGRSSIHEHDIETETLSGVFKDIMVLNKYLEVGALSELEKREVIRCIRPIIESIIRVKYFTEIKRTEWLGDMISKIRDSKSGSRLWRLKPHLESITEINDYSKEFHHGEPSSPWGDIINDGELSSYVTKTLHVINEI